MLTVQLINWKIWMPFINVHHALINVLRTSSTIKVKRVENSPAVGVTSQISNIKVRRLRDPLPCPTPSSDSEMETRLEASLANVISDQPNLTNNSLESAFWGISGDENPEVEGYVEENTVFVPCRDLTVPGCTTIVDSLDEDKEMESDNSSSENHPVSDNIFSTNVVVDVSDTIAYEVELRKSKRVMALDAHFSLVIVPDFCLVKKQLKDNRYIVVKRRSLLITEEKFQWAYSCSCDPFNASVIDTIDSTNGLSCEIDLTFNECIHTKAVKPIVEESGNCEPAIGDISSCQEDEVMQLSFDPARIVVTYQGSVGVIGRRCNQDQCLTCIAPFCKHTTFFKKQKEIDTENSIFKEYIDNFHEQQSQSISVHKAISTKKITFQPSERGQFCLRHAVTEYLQKSSMSPTNLLSEDTDIVSCECGGVLEIESSAILPLLTLNCSYTCEVFNKKCISCEKLYPYDGGNDMILNMVKVLVHHSVMRDYMFQFLHGNSCTLTSFYQKWQMTQQSAGNSSFNKSISPVFWRHTWYAYLKLLDFDVVDSALCDTCGVIPNTVVCDATSLGFQRKFATIAIHEQADAMPVIPRYSEHSKRVAIPIKALRDKFTLLISNRMSKIAKIEFLSKLKAHNRAIYNAVSWVYNVYQENAIPKAFIDLFKCLSSSSPVCSYIFPSEYCYTLLMRLCDRGIKSDIEILRALQNDIPLFFNILDTLSFDSCLPEEFKGLLLYLCDKAEAPFHGAEEISTENSSPASEFARFPNLTKVRDRGKFEQDKEFFQNSCRKHYSGHPRLLPGIFTVYCVHGVCYGYQVMENQESPNIPFTIFRTRFPKAPKVIIYDNACGLHSYCLNRDPLFFKETRFYVDRFHWKNQTGCSAGYNINLYPQMKAVNSEINEQQNASTKKLKTQLSYLNSENFIMHCDYIWYRNFLKKSS